MAKLVFITHSNIDIFAHTEKLAIGPNRLNKMLTLIGLQKLLKEEMITSLQETNKKFLEMISELQKKKKKKKKKATNTDSVSPAPPMYLLLSELPDPDTIAFSLPTLPPPAAPTSPIKIKIIIRSDYSSL